ncbi:pilus assembly protein Flp/PilA [Bryocella elongata]|uniref:Pilus assembly protein Flp/PilA n=2 Tax=Bryocella elongata TaxID=863522 RepID=A0A1H6A7K9_9BACT|nr:pilus assembly protein Flp/PilA [Bryocella elongata]
MHLAVPLTLGWDRMVSFYIEENGQDLIEYALVAGLIGLSAILSLNTVTTKIKNAFSNIGSQLTSAV